MEGSADRTDVVYSIGSQRKRCAPGRTATNRSCPLEAAGQRLYSRDQVDQLSFIRYEIEHGLQPADVHRLLAQHQMEMASNPEEQHSSAGGGVDAATTVLLAERDPYAVEFAEYFLRTEGYVVRIVLDSAAAAEILRDEPPSVLVVDLLISGGAGLALCRAARENSSVPVLAVSAVDSRDQALAAGVEAFLLKPLDPLQFVSTVRDLVGTSAYLRVTSLSR
jgi:CheY-like chemotaxis protein